MRLLKTNVLAPFMAAGLKTSSYQKWRGRSGGFVQVILNGDYSDPEWDQATEWLVFMVVRAGPDMIKAKLPDNSKLAAHYWDSVFDNATRGDGSNVVGVTFRVRSSRQPKGSLILAGTPVTSLMTAFSITITGWTGTC